jgi:hypothetical protein
LLCCLQHGSRALLPGGIDTLLMLKHARLRSYTYMHLQGRLQTSFGGSCLCCDVGHFAE